MIKTDELMKEERRRRKRKKDNENSKPNKEYLGTSWKFHTETITTKKRTFFTILSIKITGIFF